MRLKNKVSMRYTRGSKRLTYFLGESGVPPGRTKIQRAGRRFFLYWRGASLRDAQDFGRREMQERIYGDEVSKRDVRKNFNLPCSSRGRPSGTHKNPAGRPLIILVVARASLRDAQNPGKGEIERTA